MGSRYKYGTGEDRWLLVSEDRQANLKYPDKRAVAIRRHRMKKKRAKFQRDLEKWEAAIRCTEPKFQQIKHLIEKFGSLLNLSIAIGAHPVEILGWCTGYVDTWSEKTNSLTRCRRRYAASGLMPLEYLGRIILSARTCGIFLTPADLLPDLVINDTLKNSEGELKEWLALIKQEKTDRAQKFHSDLVKLRSM